MTVPSHDTLAQAAQRYGVEPTALTLVREAANAIYAFAIGGQPYILRLTPAAGRSANLIHGELDWMRYLAERGAGVSTPLRSQAGRLVEMVGEGDDCFCAAVFARVPGEHPAGELLTGQVIRDIGRELGRMHRLGESYQPPTSALRRPQWYELDVFDLELQLPPDQPAIRERWRAMLAYLRGLPTAPDVYGLIHGDPEPWNMLLHDGRLTLIDFDECCYHWYVFDLAVALFHIVLAAETEDNDDFAAMTWQSLRTGYVEEHTLTPTWQAQMPEFLRLRILEDYAFHLRLQAEGHQEPWLAGIVAYQRELLETGAPVLDVDFTT